MFEIRVYKEWDEQLQDKSSDKFKELSSLMKKEVYFKFHATARVHFS